MKIYKVGGCVRDKLLGIPPIDADWVVVGGTIEEMKEQGFKQVGLDFPVFLHPKTKEEYALARSERKVSAGYHGFEFVVDSSVTLEQDLLRRDLTINAMAEEDSGELVDPYGGQKDLKDKCLRHVSEAFAEDPVRILRTARFYARFKSRGFFVHKDTLSLMQKMVEKGEVNALQRERVWQETAKALGESNPEGYFELLDKVGALPIIFAGMESGQDWEAISTHFKERQMEREATWVLMLFLTSMNSETVAELQKSVNPPKAFKEAAMHFFTLKPLADNCKNAPHQILELLELVDAFRRPEHLVIFLQSLEVVQPAPVNQIQEAYKKAKQVDAKTAIENHPNISPKAAVHAARLSAIEDLSNRAPSF
jgi:tRNA nucleotidyltransferase (CCA-adding enzyme)